MPAAKKKQAPKKSEHTVQNIALNALAGRPATRSARFNSGKVKTEKGSWVQLAPAGFSDIGGTESIVITPDMVGKRVALAFFIEMKKEKGVRRKVQERFIRAMRLSGAKAGFAETPEEALAVLEQPLLDA